MFLAICYYVSIYTIVLHCFLQCRYLERVIPTLGEPARLTTTRAKEKMVTQAIKNWLRKLFAWWPWKQSTEIEHAHAASPLNKGTTQGAISRSAIDGVASQPQSGTAQRLSTIEEWPERVVKPLSPSPQPLSSLPTPPASSDLPETPLPPPSPSPVDKAADIFSSNVPSTPAPMPGRAPTPEQQLEFLHYLVKRGIVNEGFEEDKVPEQYRRE